MPPIQKHDNYKNQSHSALIVLLALYEMILYLSVDAYLPALPELASELHTTQSVIQLTVTAWFMGSTSLNLILGPLTDMIGRRPTLLWGGVFFIVSTIGCSLSHHIYTLLIWRVIQGATIPSMIISGYATVHELFDRQRAIHISAIMGSISVLSPAFGPLAGAGLLQIADWRWIFGLLALGGVFVRIGLFFKMPETATFTSEKKQLKQAVVQYKNIIVNAKFMRMTSIFLCLIGAMIAWITAGPFLVLTYFHQNTLYFGIAQALVFGSFILSMQLIKLLMKSIALNSLVWAGLILSGVGGLGAFIFAWILPQGLGYTVIGMILLATGSGLAFPILNRLALESSTEPMSARVAMSFFLIGVSGILGSALISRFYNGTLFSFGLILFILSFIAIFMQLLGYRRKTIDNIP